MIDCRLFHFRSLFRFAFSLLVFQGMSFAQTPALSPALPNAIGPQVPVQPVGPGEYYVGPEVPGVEISWFIGAGEERQSSSGSAGLPNTHPVMPTGMVEAYVEVDNMDFSNVDYVGARGALTANNTLLANAPTNQTTTSAISSVSVSPTANTTYTFTADIQSCYYASIPIGIIPPPIPLPCLIDCGDPGPALVSSQNLLQPAPAFSPPSFPVNSGSCVSGTANPPVSVTYGLPQIASISQQSANIGASGSFTVTGSNLQDSEGTSNSSFNTTISSTVTTPGQSSETVSFSVPGTQTPGNYQFTISNIWGASNGVSFTVGYPPATVTGISPGVWTAGQAYPGVQITGTNFGSTPTISLSDPTIAVSAPYNTSGGTGISTTYIDLSVPLTTPSEPVIVTVVPGSSGNSFIQVPGGPSLPGSNTAAVIGVLGVQQASCPSMLDANSGFSSIASTGQAPGGSGSMTVSFSNGPYNGNTVTVPYGPYSTPESIASHLAALITQKYYRSGLGAEAYGGYILYKSSATLGVANFTSSDSSFTAVSPQSCPPISMTLRLVPVASQDELQRNLNHILHNVWRLVTLNGQAALPINYTISEHTSITRGNNPFDQVYPGWSTSSGSPNIFNDGIGCTGSGPLCDNTTFMQKFTISSPNNGSNVPVTNLPVMILIPNQVPRFVMTIHDHGTALPTMNDDKGPMPEYKPNPYNDPNPYPCYNTTPC